MSEAIRQPATYEDVLGLPETVVGEIIDGKLHTHPRPAPKHARAYSALEYRLGGPFDGGIDGPGGWWTIDEPGLHLEADVLVPDLSGWRRERLPAMPETAWFELAPDCVCEILSPATRTHGRSAKMPIYARHGVRNLWLLDPDAKTLEVFALRQNHWLLLETLRDDQPVQQPPFEAVSFPLDALCA